MLVFLDLNAWHFGAEEPDVVSAMLAVASGGSREADLAAGSAARVFDGKVPKKAT